MTESYTDGVTSSLGEGHQGDPERGAGLRKEIKTAGDVKKKAL